MKIIITGKGLLSEVAKELKKLVEVEKWIGVI